MSDGICVKHGAYYTNARIGCPECWLDKNVPVCPICLEIMEPDDVTGEVRCMNGCSDEAPPKEER